MKIAVLTCGMLPIPAVQGGAVENLIDFYLEYNDQKKLHDITVYSPWNAKVEKLPALSSDVNHYIFIDVTSLKAKISRRLYGYLHRNEYYNYFIEYYFEQTYQNLRNKVYDYIILENCPGYAYKLSQRGYNNLILHLHNDLLHYQSRYHDVIFNSLTKVLTVSNYIKKRVSTIIPSDKIQTVYNGIDLQNFSPQKPLTITRKEIGFDDDDFILVYSGRINHEKGISELIDAMFQLKDFQQIKLMILGSTFFDNVMHKDAFIFSLIEKAILVKNKIVFTGFIPYEQVSNYLRLADIAVLPSMWDEPFGLTIVEAMAVGLPLITTKSGGIPEICNNVATILDRENIVTNLKNTILYLYEHPEEREQMSLKSVERSKFFNKTTFAYNFFKSLKY